MTFVGIMRCLLADSGLPKFLWGELMLTAVYLSNRAPHAALVNATRRQVYFTNGEFPDIAHKDDPVSFVEYAYSVKITQPNMPGTFQEAVKLPDAELRRAAAKKEMDSLEDLQVYKLIPRSTVHPGTRVYKSRWVLKVKADNIHKARLVVGGWGQVPGKGYGNTYAPVCRLQSVRMVLSITAERDWEVVQLDVKIAFLFAEIEKKAIVEAAPGFERMDKDGVQLPMKLGKSLYGLAQSPRN